MVRSTLQPLAGSTLILPDLLTVKMEKQAGQGYGALGVEAGDLYVWSVSPGTPAAEAGIKRGDRLVKIDAHVLSSWMSVELELSALDKKPFALTWSSGGVEQTKELAQAMITVEDDFKNRIAQLELGILERPAFRGGRDTLAGGPSEEMVTLSMGPKEAFFQSVKNLPKIIRLIPKCASLNTSSFSLARSASACPLSSVPALWRMRSPLGSTALIHQNGESRRR